MARIWTIYQAVILAYEEPNRRKGREKLASIIDALDKTNTKRGIPELRTLKNTLKKRRNNILAYFTHPGSSNGPTEAINSRLEHLRGITLGFRNLDNYIKRSLPHTGGIKHQLQPLL
ncbi:transposase [Actinomycetaceae bacterium WB03_NA08]|uniref:Transposase n=1 Tax=Scrofimicrobium canadense TaxID=2652290 RepID=A0A6N7WA11_9ACTO|nr:transposase [Scrofimicrobium canadense]